MTDSLTIRDAWVAMRDHIGTLPTDDPEAGDYHGIAADVFLTLTNAYGDASSPDMPLTRDDLPPYLAGDDPRQWFPVSCAGHPGVPLPATIMRWIADRVPYPAA